MRCVFLLSRLLLEQLILVCAVERPRSLFLLPIIFCVSVVLIIIFLFFDCPKLLSISEVRERGRPTGKLKEHKTNNLLLFTTTRCVGSSSFFFQIRELFSLDNFFCYRLFCNNETHTKTYFPVVAKEIVSRLTVIQIMIILISTCYFPFFEWTIDPRTMRELSKSCFYGLCLLEALEKYSRVDKIKLMEKKNRVF